MKKILVYVFPGFCEFEITPTLSALRKEFDVKTFALTAAPIISESGLTIIPDLTYDEIYAEAYEAIIIPGGDMAVNVKAYPIFKLVHQFYSQKKLVGAICSGPFILAQAGVLCSNSYTVSYTKEQRELLGCFSEINFRYQPIVTAEEIITAQGHAFIEFALAIYQTLAGKPSPDEAFYRGTGNGFMDIK